MTAHRFSPLQHLLLSTTVLCGLVCACGPPALANPQGGSVAAGSASIQAQGKQLDIRQQSSKATIDWSSFDIAPGETTQFFQPSAQSITLNRIGDVRPSQIEGSLLANGNILLVNPNGVVFGRDATVNVNSLVATSSDIANDAFMNQSRLTFNKPGRANAIIANAGQITVKDAGLVGLVAPQVDNSGTITARLGKVQLASGDSFTLDLAGDGITQVAVTGDIARQIVSNSGSISADGGQIQLTAAAARQAVDSLIVNTGELKADTFKQQ